MRRLVIGFAVAAALAASGRAALGDDGEVRDTHVSADGEVRDTHVSADEIRDPQLDTHTESSAPGAKQELTGNIGGELGGRLTPGGARAAGAFLYRLNDHDWLETSLAFTFGGNAPGCFRDRQDDFVCDQSIASGFASELGVALRRYFAARGNFHPYGKVGLGARFVSFSSDDVRGIAVPLTVGAGVRVRLTPRIGVHGEAGLRVGWGILNRSLGLEPQGSLGVAIGADFAL